MKPSLTTESVRPGAMKELMACVSPETVARENEPLGRRTTLRVGGPADFFVEPANEHDLAAVVHFCRTRSLPFFVLGRGSNLLVKDAGFRGVAISLGHPWFSRIQALGEKLCCGAGARLKTVALQAKRNSLAGLEFLEGIPGSVGGALRMNAGAMGGAIFDVAERVKVMDHDGAVQDCVAAELQAQYRSCPALKHKIALAALLRGHPGVREDIENRLSEFARKRWSSQPAAPSAGCIFKNPPGIPAGKLIDELGLKGTRVGGAMISKEHGNFLVNDGTATASQVLQLIELIRSRAREARGIELETEVVVIGD